MERSSRRTRGLPVALLLLAVTTALVAACSGGDDGLSRDQAIEAARSEMPSAQNAEAVSARDGRFADFDPNATEHVSPPDRHVWGVLFRGTFAPPSCGPIPAPGETVTCSPPHETMMVIVDYRTGEFISAGSPATADGLGN